MSPMNRMRTPAT